MRKSRTRYLPFVDTIRTYQRPHLKNDLLAGLTVGTILIPQGLAYASLAGVPPIYGLYAGLVPLILYALYASSTKLSVGPVAVSALLVYSGVSKLATPGSEQYISLVITLGLLVGIVQIIIGICRFGFLANFLSHPVISGFTSAAAIIIVLSQLKDALGLELEQYESTLANLWGFLKNIENIHLPTLAITVLSIGFILTTKKISTKIPGALIALVLATAASYFFNFESYGIETIREVPAGLPTPSIPRLDWETVNILMTTVLAVTVIGIVESIGIAKALESKHKDHNLDPDQELLALGLAKVGGAFFQAIPTSGSFSRSAINSNTGGKTTVSSLVSALLVLVALLFLTTTFYHLPKAVLAAIILLAVLSLFDYKEALYLWKTNKRDLALMLATFILTIILGIEAGVMSGVALSIMVVLYKSSRPYVVELGQVEGTEYFKDPKRFASAKLIELITIFRFDHQLYFGNAAFFREQLYNILEGSEREIEYVLLDASHINDIDSTGMHMLKDLVKDLELRSIELHISGASGPVRDRLYVSGLLNEIDKHHVSLTDAVLWIQKNELQHSDNSINPLQTNIS